MALTLVEAAKLSNDTLLSGVIETIAQESPVLQRRPGGYVATYRFQGYAYLVRRDLFVAIGGFDAQFGLGYFEDTDLGRRLVQQGWCRHGSEIGRAHV